MVCPNKKFTMSASIVSSSFISPPINSSFSSSISNYTPLLSSFSSSPLFLRFPLKTLRSSSSRCSSIRYRRRRRRRSGLCGDRVLVRAFQKTDEAIVTVPNMTITPAIKISDSKLLAKNHTILTAVPDTIIATSASSAGPVEGVFIGAVFDEDNSRHVTTLGTLKDVRFMACFRFKLWWMAQRMGDSGRDVPLETQFLLVESRDGDDEGTSLYTVFLPLIEGPFRACLQGNAEDELELCLESGDVETKASSFTHALFVMTGTDPFATITSAIKAVKSHLKRFRQRHEKSLPGIVDYFGWCTWDAFYQEVTQEGVEAGLASLTAGGAPPKFVIIDDGWQLTGGDTDVKQPPPLLRLTGIKENQKFQKKDDPSVGIKNIVSIAKEKYGLKYVYVWHAITGYWGGVRPGVEEMKEYGSAMKYPLVSKGVLENEPVWKNDAMAIQGLGLVNPKSAFKFFNDMHSYLAEKGIDGVKVDVQCILETLGGGLGGRVELTRQYHQALDTSVSKNFPDNGCIACMSHNTDALYCSKQTAIVRGSDDFYPRDPISHTIHIACVAYNSVFLGEFMQPDWDMFHSQHPAGEYHGSARAISGGPLYVSDAPGKHNFELLKKLVLPDGSILRARLPGRPTRDCLFNDPARDGVSLLKIWNMNKYTGVLGVYNCQGAAWNSTERINTFHQTGTDALTSHIRGQDVHLIPEAATDPESWTGDCAVYCHRNGQLVTLPHNAALPVSLKVLEYEVYTVTPIKVVTPGVNFAPLGLIHMFNAGGAIQGLEYELIHGKSGSVGKVEVQVKGCGIFGAYSSVKPRKATLGSNAVEFTYDSESGLVSLSLDQMPDENQKFHIVEIEL
ncbi:putative galactinol--sucrose galactosyltransferase 6 [Drosera capensis]